MDGAIMSMSDASGNGQISTINTGKWKKKDLSEAGRYLRKKYRAKR